MLLENLHQETEDSEKVKMDKIVLATKNKGKLFEIHDLLKNIDIEALEIQGHFSPIEDGATFSENAYKKAFAAAKIMKLPAVADDSGLEIDVLDGEPGIYSARYAENDEKRIERVLSELRDVPAEYRTARFTCAMVLVGADGKILHACRGYCEGLIIDEKRGTNGFGYDPVFYIPELDKTMAELTLDEKNRISHRSKALKDMIEWLKKAV